MKNENPNLVDWEPIEALSLLIFYGYSTAHEHAYKSKSNI